MQSKEMFKLTPQLCRVAKKEYNERLAELPKDVKCDVSFGKVLHLIQHVEKSEFAQAMELLADAYKEHQEMMSYYATETKVTITTIFPFKLLSFLFPHYITVNISLKIRL